MRLGTLDLTRRHAIGVGVLLAVNAIALAWLGQPWWCGEGDVRPWSFDIWSPHNSQHLIDPYTVTHAMHGVATYGLLWLLLRSRLTPADRGLIGVALEVVWEVVENTPMVIERYRESTMALNYYGDSVINSLGDTLAFAGGWAIAATVPVWVSAAGFVLADVGLMLWIRDGLVLNVLMLVWPVEAIREWQTAGVRVAALTPMVLRRGGLTRKFREMGVGSRGVVRPNG